MTPEVRERFSQVQNGQVPEGYKKGKLGIVPKDWDNVKFSDLFTSTSDFTDDLEHYPLYSLTIENGITAKTERYERSHLVKKQESYKIVRPNDYAYNPMNIRFGAVARHKGNFPVSVSGYYDIFTTVHPEDLTFMDDFLTCSAMITYYNKVSTGSLIEKQRVHFSQFLDFTFALPNTEERRKIAEILAAQDQLIELKEKLIAEKQKQKKYLMQQLLSPKVSMNNGVRLDQVCEFNPKTSNNTEEKVTFLAMNGVDESGKIIHSNIVPYVTVSKGYTSFERGDILVAKITPCFENGKGALTDHLETNIGFGSTEFHVLRCKNIILPKFLFYHTQSSTFRKKLESEMVGSAGQKRIQKSSIASYVIFLPSIDRQKSIVKILETADREIELLQLDLEQEKLKKKALMQLLLTGIVRVHT